MKANELMLGDWVNLKNGKVIMPCRITVIGHATQDRNEIGTTVCVDLSKEFPTCIFDIDVITPIPLTPEILEKNGFRPFEINKMTEKATAKWWHKMGYFFIKQYHFKHHNFKPTYSFGCNNHTLIEGIEYVHELQHALKLCRIKNEIEL